MSSIANKELVGKLNLELNKERCREVIEQYVKSDYRDRAGIGGGFFFENATHRQPHVDIYIFAGDRYCPTENDLNYMLISSEGDFEKDTISPRGQMAEKNIDNDTTIRFVSIDFPSSDDQVKQLLNTYEIELCKIFYAYNNNKLYCGDWFLNGGDFYSHKPSTWSVLNERRECLVDFLTRKKTAFYKTVDIYTPVNRELFVDLNKIC